MRTGCRNTPPRPTCKERETLAEVIVDSESRFPQGEGDVAEGIVDFRKPIRKASSWCLTCDRCVTLEPYAHP